MVKDQAKEADWHMQYFCAEQRIYLKLFVFDSQQAAIDYAESFMKRVEAERKQTQGNSRLELIHRWTVNGPLLFIIRGDDERTVSTLLSHFAG